MIRDACFRFYWKVRGWLAPGLRYSQYSYEEAIAQHVSAETRWLELGCGHAVLPAWRFEQERELVQKARFVAGLDYDLPSLKLHRTISRLVRGDITRLPYQNGTFDLVTMNMVVEHLDNPERQFEEVYRILAPGGVLIFHTPNAYGYGVIAARLVPEFPKRKFVSWLEGRPEGDIFKTFYRANTKRRVKALAQACGYQVAEIRLICTDAILASVPPLFIPELIVIRALMTKPFESLRTNIIGVLRKAV